MRRLAVQVLVIVIFVYFNVLPYHFSPQIPLDLSKLGGQFEAGLTIAHWHRQKVVPPATALAKISERVLGDSAGDKRIEVDLTNQKLYMVENNNRRREFLVSTGKWGKTPTGTFAIWTKLRYTRMRGGNPALGTWYDLPNVPYTMFFGSKEVPNWKGFGVHGTYWHNNFGRPMSHGCINMKTEEAAVVFDWAEVGTPVVIYGVAPNS